MVLQQETALFWLFLTVVIASAGGYLIYRVGRASVYNGQWEKLPEGRKRIIGMSGVISSLLAGLGGVYAAPTPVDTTEFVRTLSAILVAQIIAGWLGTEYMKRFGTKGGDDE